MKKVTRAFAPLLLAFLQSASAISAETPPASWMEEAQRGIASSEYNVSVNDAGLQAPNRAGGFRTYFDAQGLSWVDRSAPPEAAATPMAGLRLLETGRDGKRRSPGEATINTDAGQVRFDWSSVEALYDNSKDGLAQTLTVHQRPPGDAGFEVVFAVEGAIAHSDSGELKLRGGSGGLRLQNILAVDAHARPLPVSQVIQAQTFVVKIDDADASYPLTIKALIEPGINGIIQANQADSNLGFSVAGAGDVNGDGYSDILVGAYTYDAGESNNGAAFLYFGGPGIFDTTVDAQLTVANSTAKFGYAVTGAGDLNGDGFSDIAIGAPNYRLGPINTGSVFIYFGGLGAFNSSVDAVLRPDQPGSYFGASVAAAGDVNGDGFGDLILGATEYYAGQTDEGAAFVYFGGAGAFDTTSDALLQADQTDSLFGWSVSGAGDLNGDGYADVLVGAPFFDNFQINKGATFVYFGGPGNFDTTADAQLEVNVAIANFGWSVAGGGDVNGDGYSDIVVGARTYANGQTAEGAAFVYLGGPGSFNTTQHAKLELNFDNALFGTSVANNGDINGDGYADILVGAPFYKNGQIEEGSIWIFEGGPGAFDITPDAQIESNQISARFGSSVAIVGDVDGDGFVDIVVGSPQFSYPESSEGVAFLYYGGASDFNFELLRLESNQGAALSGISVSGAGDLNGDGYGDLVVGALLYDSGQADEGAAFIYFGREGSLSTTPDARVESNQTESGFGQSVAAAGDLNGDGFGDLIVGAPLFDDDQLDEGAAFVYYGGSGAFNTNAVARLDGNQVMSFFGFTVSGAGDLNGDGHADVVVGAPLYDGSLIDEGASFVYFGGAGGFNTTRDASLFAGQAGGSFGSSVDGAGDVNGDGFGDLIVGARNYTGTTAEQGAAYLYFGGSGPFNTIADTFFTYAEAGAKFGSSVAGAGDLNGDGYADIIIGAPFFDEGAQVDEGAAYIYLGSSGAFSSNAHAILQSELNGVRFGTSVDGAGDVNGDGYGDVLIGAPLYTRGANQNFEGAVYTYFGGPGAFNVDADKIFQGGQADANLGSSVAGAGDLDGDGFAEIVAGSAYYDNGQSDEGAAFVYYGNNKARAVMASQFRGNGNTSVEPWGFSYKAQGFVVSMQATSPRGRERAKLQVEACASGVAFGSPACSIRTAGNWTELGANPQGVTLAMTIDGLNTEWLYHWRARVLHAPLTINAAGILAPPKPTAGPWRRLQAHSQVHDIRTGMDLDWIFGNGFD